MSLIESGVNTLNSVAFLSLGCKVNSYETEAIKKLFEDEDFTVVDFSEKADVYVINTCTVTNIADRKSRQMLHKARKLNEHAIVVAVGCYAQAAGEVLKEDEAIDIVIGNNRKKDIIHILKEYVYGETLIDTIIDINKETEYEELSIESVAEKTRAYIKIQDGCNQFCSYCIIPYARGRVRSRREDDVMKEVKSLVAQGYKEIVLTGIHLSSYGVDFNNKDEFTEDALNMEHNLLNLIVELSTIDGLMRIRLGSLEPRIITEKFVKTLSSNDKLCPHFHLSLQSGSNATLKRMNRRYNATEYLEKCNLLRKYFKNPAITTDVIVGFPGETEEEFLETKEFVDTVNFASMHIFKYSIRKGTKAATMKEQVKDEIKTDRSNQLMELEKDMSYAYKEGFIGSIEKVLIEESVELNGKVYQTGHNERYVKLGFESEKDYTNEVVNVKVLGLLNKDIMFCEIMD